MAPRHGGRPRDPIVRTVPQPADMNGNGDIFGGWVLSQMDVAGGSLAARVAKGRVATVAITAMTFVQPIKVGDMVSIYGKVAKVGRTSITIDLETIVQRRHEIGRDPGDARHLRVRRHRRRRQAAAGAAGMKPARSFWPSVGLVAPTVASAHPHIWISQAVRAS